LVYGRYGKNTADIADIFEYMNCFYPPRAYKPFWASCSMHFCYHYCLHSGASRILRILFKRSAP